MSVVRDIEAEQNRKRGSYCKRARKSGKKFTTFPINFSFSWVSQVFRKWRSQKFINSAETERQRLGFFNSWSSFLVFWFLGFLRMVDLTVLKPLFTPIFSNI